LGQEELLAICIVSHDAGGAEILSSYARRKNTEFLYVLEGPARRIFERKLGCVDVHPLEKALRNSECVLCGTSWQSYLEVDALRMARSMGKRSVAFLDHWVNYRERFVRAGLVHLPDEIWVGDLAAQGIADSVFPELNVRLVDNPYFLDLGDQLTELQSPGPGGLNDGTVLYVCEPVREPALRQYGDERHLGYVEEDALRYFLENIGALGAPVARILIRPHPSEAADKYSWAREEFDLPIAMGGDRTLLEEIAESDVVVGCESMALVVALHAGKRAISIIPPGGKACELPQPEIEHLRLLVGNQ